MNFQHETLFDVIEEVQPLLERHFAELARNQDRITLNPDWARYAATEQNKALLVFTARDKGELVGYAAFIVGSHLHYRDLTVASNDVLWLAPAHRVGRTGVRLIRFCEQMLTEQLPPHHCIAWHAKENTALASMLGRMGYGVQDILFTKLASASALSQGA